MNDPEIRMGSARTAHRGSSALTLAPESGSTATARSPRTEEDQPRRCPVRAAALLAAAEWVESGRSAVIEQQN